MRKFLVLLFLSLFPVFWISFLLCGEIQGDEGTVGVATCKACHPKRYESYAASIHSRKAIPNSPANKSGCESCHGPGAAHLEKMGARGAGIFVFSKKLVDAEQKSARCLSCHSETPRINFWDMGRHRAEGISCDNCHTVHAGTRKNLKAQQPDLCNICHLSIRAQENKQSHHPIKEGKVKCSDCHNFHGGFGTKMIAASSVNDLCYKCHAERRGPFFWEHPPVEENCLTCHVPHGSNHSKLLTDKPPKLCQACHDAAGHPSTPYTSFETFRGSATGSKNRMFARGCLNCHSNIHGSMGPSVRGRRFVR
jgi:DmsE family decaheme c-type cytochrome